MRSNNGDALRAAALGGLGLIYQPGFLVADDLRSGRLVAISLDQPTMTVGHVHAVFRPDRHLPAKSRSVIDVLAARLGDEPPWDASPSGHKAGLRAAVDCGSREIGGAEPC